MKTTHAVALLFRAAAPFLGLLATVAPLRAGHFTTSIVPITGVPWPGGIVPYDFAAGTTPVHQQAFLDGVRDWELAGNVQFIPRTTQTQWVRFKYAPNGPNLVSGSAPQLIEVNSLMRRQVLHEVGHSLGLLHEHTRADRNSRVTINSLNITPGNAQYFTIESGTLHGAYDFESVMHFGRDVFSTQPGELDTITANAGYEKFQPRLGNVALSPGDRALVKQLYGAATLSSVVTKTADFGPGSLRAAIYHATDHPGTTITFNIPASDPGFANGVFTIQLTGHLPPLVTNGTIIDATTQPGYAGKPLVFLDGSAILPETGANPGIVPGLFFYEEACRAKGLGIKRMPWVGIAMLYASAKNNVVSACWLGLDHTGAAAAPNGFQGVQISAGANGNVIGGTAPADRNVISGNTQYGVWMSDAGTTGNTVLGNYIGTTWTGAAALPNMVGGVIITGDADGNIIGGAGAGARNVISGNTDAGVWITGAGVTGNTVRGNFIGLNAAGATALPNTFSGINILKGAQGNTVAGNVISGNADEGIRIEDAGTSGNVVRSNFIGLNAAGIAPVPHGFAGVTIFKGASGNTIGGAAPGAGNFISGHDNFRYGVVIADPGSDGNFVQGNTIGLGVTGASVPNSYGVALWNGAKSNTIGGAASGAGNIIASNTAYGIVLFNPDVAGTKGHTFSGNGIFNNGFSGISIGAGNTSQAAPSLTSAVLGAAGTTVGGTLNSAANKNFRIEFFADAPGASQGRTFIGSKDNVPTNGSGAATFSAALPPSVAKGDVVTATATNLTTGDTSPFSAPLIVTATDSDNDGMPNAYETANGLNSGVNDAALDQDGDGLSNLAEFQAGTNPQSPTSSFQVKSVARSGDDVILTIPTVAGKIYRVLKTSDLAAGGWRVMATFLVGTGGEMPITDTGAALEPRAFYQAVVAP